MNHQDDELLARVVSGELDVNSPEIRGLLARSPEVKDELEALFALQSRLDRERRDDRDAIESAKSATDAGDEGSRFGNTLGFPCLPPSERIGARNEAPTSPPRNASPTTSPTREGSASAPSPACRSASPTVTTTRVAAPS